MAAPDTVSHEEEEEDEKYLYDDNLESSEKDVVKEINDSEQSKVTNNRDAEPSKEPKNEEEDDDGEFEESDDDDDDDNIQVHIGDVNTSATGAYGTPLSWKKEGTALGAVKAATLPTQGQKKIDVNTVGLINGQPIYEYDLDTEQDEKPWRKPGADISDYFNYGFTEDTWKQYCEKQRRMRLDSQRGPYTVTAANPVANAAQVEIEVLPDGRTRVKAGPPPDRKVEGSIHVLGSDADARRKQKEDELLALALGSSRVMAQPTFPGQRPLYTTLPNGAVVYNPLAGQQMLQPTSSQGETTGMTAEPQNSSQGQQIQSIGAPSMMTSVMPPAFQYLSHGGPGLGGIQPIAGGSQIFPPPNMDNFVHPGMPSAGYAGQFGHSDSDFDSDGENRRHRSRRESSRHRRHRDRSDRDRSDRDRERSSRRDRDRSESRRSRDHSKSSSDRRRHSSRSVKTEENDSDRKSRTSRRNKQPSIEEEEQKPLKETETVTIKQELVED